MNLPVVPFVGQVMPTGSSGDGTGSPARLDNVAQEFEAMLIHQLLKQMREASNWFGTEDEDRLFGNQLLETIDVELARQLAIGGGLGLAEVLMPRLLGGTGVEPANPSGVEANSQPLPDSARSEYVTSAFGLRQDPIAGDSRFHAGVDFRAAYGREIGAAGPGRVVFAGEQGGYGLTVVIEHSGGVRTRYAHLSSIQVSEGEAVGAQDPIGRAGDTGRATGSHLHFELIRDGERIDPSTVKGGIEGLLKKLRLSADWSNSRT